MVDLAKVRGNFERRAQHFLEAELAATSAKPRERDRLVAYVAIEMQNSLSYVARSVFLAHAVVGTNAAGIRVGAVIYPNNADALYAAARVVHTRKKNKVLSVPGRDEPAWHSTNQFALVANKLGLPGYVAGAMTPWTRTVEVLKVVRHFYAHRNKSTLGEVRHVLRTRMGYTLARHLSEELVRPQPGKGPLLEAWIWHYVDLVERLCS